MVPARYGSSRWPGKVLARVAGKPLLRWAWDTLASVNEVSEVVIATDDERVREWASGAGLRVLMTSAGCVNGTERVGEISRMVSGDYFINLQADQVGLEARVVSRMIHTARLHREWGMVTAATREGVARCVGNPNRVLVIAGRCSCGRHWDAAQFVRGDRITPAGMGGLLRHLGVYGYSPAFLKLYSGASAGPEEKNLQLEQCRAFALGKQIGVVRVRSGAMSCDSVADRNDIERHFQKDRPGKGETRANT